MLGTSIKRDGVNMPNTKPAPQEQILPIVLGFWQARALAVATDLGYQTF